MGDTVGPNANFRGRSRCILWIPIMVFQGGGGDGSAHQMDGGCGYFCLVEFSWTSFEVFSGWDFGIVVFFLFLFVTSGFWCVIPPPKEILYLCFFSRMV